MKLPAIVVALIGTCAVPLCAATVPFSFTVDAQLRLLSPLPVVGIEANGFIITDRFGAGTYFTNGALDYGSSNADGSSTGTGVFTFDFGVGNQFSGTFVETAFPPEANGDIRFSHVYTINAGTGIFAGASGTASHGDAITNLGVLAIDFDGSGSVSAPSLQAVPEPGTLGLLGAGLALMLGTSAVRRTRA